MIAPVEATTVRQSLCSKGFKLCAKGLNRDHEHYLLWLDGIVTTFYVKISRGAKELRRDEIKNNARGVQIRGDDLYRVLTCEYDVHRTAEIARAAGHGSRQP